MSSVSELKNDLDHVVDLTNNAAHTLQETKHTIERAAGLLREATRDSNQDSAHQAVGAFSALSNDLDDAMHRIGVGNHNIEEYQRTL